MRGHPRESGSARGSCRPGTPAAPVSNGENASVESLSGDGRWGGVALMLFADLDTLARGATAAAQ